MLKEVWFKKHLFYKSDYHCYEVIVQLNIYHPHLVSNIFRDIYTNKWYIANKSVHHNTFICTYKKDWPKTEKATPANSVIYGIRKGFRIMYPINKSNHVVLKWYYFTNAFNSFFIPFILFEKKAKKVRNVYLYYLYWGVNKALYLEFFLSALDTQESTYFNP